MPPSKPSDPPDRANSLVFIHSGDLQIGKPYSSIVDDAKRARAQQERLEAIRRIGAVVREQWARFVVLAGDVFDSPTPAHATISAALGAFAAIGVPIYAIPGNHDHAGPDSVWETAFFRRERERVAPHFHLLDSPAVTVVNLEVGGVGPASVVLLPCPLLRRHHADDPTAWVRSLDFSALGDSPRIVIAHGSTAVFSGAFHIDDDGEAGRPANSIAIDRLPIEHVDYVALGDWHGFMAVGPKAWYSGTHEIDRFPKPGQEPGHVACVTVGRGAPPKVEAVRTGRFRWLSHTITLDTESEPEANLAPAAAGGGASVGTASAGAAASARAGTPASETVVGGPESSGPAYLDAWLTQATQPKAEGEPGFDGSLARITVTGTVSLAGRQELDRIIESWEARLLRLDLVDTVRISPTADEIHDLAARPNDPIISRVATELVQLLEAGGPQAEIDVVRQAIFMLHALAHPNTSGRRNDTPPPESPARLTDAAPTDSGRSSVDADSPSTSTRPDSPNTLGVSS